MKCRESRTGIDAGQRLLITIRNGKKDKKIMVYCTLDD
ncbi:MAG: hypothetical protein ACJAU1_001833 [Psychromonas sp.]|jgi:hypothetical protein